MKASSAHRSTRHTHAQGHLVREALGRAGVPAVFAGGGSVFSTPSATSWLRLLEALEQPHRAGRVRSAALSVFLGYDEQSLDAGGDELTDELGPQLRRWADVLADRGVAAFLEVLTAERGLPGRVLARPDGERVLTDLRWLPASPARRASLTPRCGRTGPCRMASRRGCRCRRCPSYGRKLDKFRSVALMDVKNAFTRHFEAFPVGKHKDEKTVVQVVGKGCDDLLVAVHHADSVDLWYVSRRAVPGR
jgi:hypothetical protein